MISINNLNLTEMKVKSVILMCLIMSIAFINQGMAQGDWKWPEEKATAETKNALYSDALKNDNYRVAANHLYWLLQNAPDLNPSIYINGAKIYAGLAEQEKDKSKQAVYADSALLMYDLRIQYFNEEADVLNRKAYEAYKYYRGEKDKYPELLELYGKTFDLNKNDVMGVNTIAYMDIIRRAKLSGVELADEEIIEKYDMIISILDHKIADPNEKNAETYEDYKGTIDAMLAEIVTVDCNFIENNLGPKLKANPEDVKTAKKIISFSLTGKCTDTPLFLEAAKIVHKVEPNYGIVRVLALRSKAAGDLDQASTYFEEGLTLTEQNTEKAEIYMELADIAAKRGQKSTARDYALKAVGVDPSKTEAYTFIGDLYFKSYEQCKGGENIVKDRGVFLAAYEMYQRGGASSRMQSAKEQFPSAEEIFTYNMEVGQELTVGCWINETVTIQKR